MLDKSIPYQNIIMCAERESLLCLKEPTLPSGVSFRLFCPGDEKQWARLEWQVGEFATEKEAIDYFLKITWLLKHYCGSAVGLFGMKKKIRRRQLRRPGLNR